MARPAAFPWRPVFAAGLVLRLLLLVPALGSLSMGVVAFAVVVNVAIAAGVLAGSRGAIAIGIYAAAIGMAGLVFGLSFAQPVLWFTIGATSAALVIVGVMAWRTTAHGAASDQPGP